MFCNLLPEKRFTFSLLHPHFRQLQRAMRFPPSILFHPSRKSMTGKKLQWKWIVCSSVPTEKVYLMKLQGKRSHNYCLCALPVPLLLDTVCANCWIIVPMKDKLLILLTCKLLLPFTCKKNWAQSPCCSRQSTMCLEDTIVGLQNICIHEAMRESKNRQDKHYIALHAYSEHRCMNNHFYRGSNTFPRGNQQGLKDFPLILVLMHLY